MSHLLKLARADEHLDSLDQAAKRFLDTNPYGHVEEFDPQRGHKIFRAKVAGTPPDELSLLLGDCLHNLRCTLDHLVFALAAKVAGPPPFKGHRAIAFPIREGLDLFEKDVRSRLRHLSEDARTAVQGLQPYQRNDPRRDPLLLLRNLNNSDKHRELVPTGAVSKTSRVAVESIADVRLIDQHVQYGGFKDGAEIAYVRFAVTGPNPKVDVDLHVAFDIALGERGWENEPLVPTLRRVRDHIANVVVPALEPFL